MEIREEIITVNATVKIKGKFPARLNKHSNLEDEKEKLLDVIGRTQKRIDEREF